jgi:hypothetical protein
MAFGSFYTPFPPHVSILRADITSLHQKGRVSLAVVEYGLGLIGLIIHKPQNADHAQSRTYKDHLSESRRGD